MSKLSKTRGNLTLEEALETNGKLIVERDELKEGIKEILDNYSNMSRGLRKEKLKHLLEGE